MWYGSFFYFLFFCFSILFVFLIIKLIFSNFLNKFIFNYFYTHLLLTFFIFTYLTVLLFSYILYENYKSVSFYSLEYFALTDNLQVNLLNDFFSLNYNLLNLYYFPFIYIFLIITVLSVLFCLN